MSHSIVRASTPIGELKLNPRWHEQMLLVPLRETDLPVERTRAALSQLMQEVGAEQHTTPLFNFNQELTHRVNSGRANDSQQWRVSFGADDDNYAQGVVAIDRPSGGPRSYAVFVHSGGGAASQALHEFALANPAMPVRTFIESPQYRLTEQYAKRNALRIAAMIGGALTTAGAQTIIDAEPDRTAYRPHVNIAPEVLARPSYYTSYNCFDTTHVAQDTMRAPVVLYRDEVANVNKTRGEILKMLDANIGMMMRTRDSEATSTHFVEPVAAARVFERQEQNDAFMAQKEDDRRACRVYAQTHFITRTGEAPSSNSRVFWRTIATEMPARTDTLLKPHVMIVYGKPARQRAV